MTEEKLRLLVAQIIGINGSVEEAIKTCQDNLAVLERYGAGDTGQANIYRQVIAKLQTMQQRGMN